MSERLGFWNWFWKLFGLRVHYFVINELDRDNGRKVYRHYKRRFLWLYKVVPVVKDGMKMEGLEKTLWQGHFETIIRKKHPLVNLLSTRFHIGNGGSETPWDGHCIIFGMGFYWGHSGFRKLAEWLTRCSGYKYDTRDWVIRISDGSLWWEFANHSDMCGYDDRNIRLRKKNHRRGSFNLSIAEAIWGPKRYSYVDEDEFEADIVMPEGSYPAVIKLQKVRFGRTKVAKSKHETEWHLDVDVPKGVPSHYDRSGGWKGDRTYGFGVKFKLPNLIGWEQDALNCVTARVFEMRGESGFREPQEVDSK